MATGYRPGMSTVDPPDPSSPPTVGQHAARVGGAAVSMLILGYIERYVWRILRPYLPQTILRRAERAATRFADNLIWGCLFSVFFFVVFGVAILGVLGIVAYAVITSM